MKKLPCAVIIALLPFLTQCEDREQRMLFEAAKRTESENPTAPFTEEAYQLTIRFRPGTQLAHEAEARIAAIQALNAARR